jgi:MFS family permease
VLALLYGAFFMVLLDGTITIVALPSIGAGLRCSEQGLPWVLSAYALTFGGLLLLGGRRLTCSAGVACSSPVSCSSRPRRCCAGWPGRRPHCWRPAWPRAPAPRS